MSRKPTLDAARRAYGAMMAAASGSGDHRIGETFATLPREAFLPPPPWRLLSGPRLTATLVTDPADLYQNALISLDPAKGINNGEPTLHAAWIGALAPKPGEAVTHIGAGTGYYTAALSLLVAPGGSVTAFEVDESLAKQAAANLATYANVSVVAGDATKLPLPPSDIVYVNAGVVAPPPAWLASLRPGARMIFPWRPVPEAGLALLVTPSAAVFSVRALSPAWFIPCVGASDPVRSLKTPTPEEAWSVDSAWLTETRVPDASAIAIYDGVWFSTAPA